MRTFGRSVAAAAVSVAVVATGSYAAAAPSATPSPWRAPQSLSPVPGGAERAAVAANAAGSAVASWVQPDGSGGWVVQTAHRHFGGPWGPPETISGRIDSQFVRPQVAIDSNGNAAAVWDAPDPANADGRLVRAAVFPAAIGLWQPAETISTAGTASESPEVVLEPGGSVVTAWMSRPSGQPISAARIESAVRPASAGTWTMPQAISQTGADTLILRVNGSGTVLAAWRLDDPPDASFQTATRPAAGSWGAPESLPAPGPQILDVAIGPGGELLAAGPELPPAADEPRVIVVADHPPGGTWSPYRPISDPAGTVAVREPRLAIDAQGNATALWGRVVRQSGTRNVATAVVAQRPPGGSWTAPVRLSSAGRVAYPAGLAVNDEGTAVALWERPRGGFSEALRAAVRLGPVAEWGGSELVVGFARGRIGDTGLSIDARGNALASWIRSGPQGTATGARLRTSDRVAGPPGTLRLTRRQLLINQRVAQAATRRANALIAAIEAGVGTASVRHGALTGTVFGASVQTAGTYDGTIVAPGPRAQIAVPAPGSPGSGQVTLSARQLLINQRIGQAAVRRANALRRLLVDGLPGGAFSAGSITQALVAPGVSLGATSPAPAPEPVTVVVSPPGGGTGGQVRLRIEQLVINQRVYQAAIVRLNAIRAQLEVGVSGASVRDGALDSTRLAP